MTKPGESRGLKFLQSVRPKAIHHLLQFFGESARHLDPKTRFLISIVTKVISHSERGLRQYVKRALAEGASPDEILDAVLCAYPCAGLTKVVDAIDTILDMDIPGFDAISLMPPEADSEPEKTEGDWLEAAPLKSVPKQGGLLVELKSRAIAIFRHGDEILAVDDECPHRGGSLAAGLVEEGAGICPLHRWKFSLTDGHCLQIPTTAVDCYPAKVEENTVFVQV